MPQIINCRWNGNPRNENGKRLCPFVEGNVVRKARLADFQTDHLPAKRIALHKALKEIGEVLLMFQRLQDVLSEAGLMAESMEQRLSTFQRELLEQGQRIS